MNQDRVEEQLTGLVRRDFQSAGDALGAVLAATTAISDEWTALDMAGSEGRLRVRAWLEQLWRGVSKISMDFDARSFSISVAPGGQITVTFQWGGTEDRTGSPPPA
jgi:hypothetical protein